MFHCAEVGAIDTDRRRTVRFSWRELAQHLILIQADGESEVLVCIREAVDDVPESFLRVGKKGAVVSEQQLSVELLSCFVRTRRRRRLNTLPSVRKRMQMPSWLTEHNVEEDGEQYWGQDASVLDAVGDGEAARQ